jgi:hypothetical protein
METCLETGNAPSVYLIEEVTGSIPVAPIILSCFHRKTKGRRKRPRPYAIRHLGTNRSA